MHHRGDPKQKVSEERMKGRGILTQRKSDPCGTLVDELTESSLGTLFNEAGHIHSWKVFTQIISNLEPK